MEPIQESWKLTKFTLKPKLSKRDKEILFDNPTDPKGLYLSQSADRTGFGYGMMLLALPFLFIYNLIRFIFWSIREFFKLIMRKLT